MQVGNRLHPCMAGPSDERIRSHTRFSHLISQSIFTLVWSDLNLLLINNMRLQEGLHLLLYFFNLHLHKEMNEWSHQAKEKVNVTHNIINATMSWCRSTKCPRQSFRLSAPCLGPITRLSFSRLNLIWKHVIYLPKHQSRSHVFFTNLQRSTQF